jgi:hypothetical protein
MTVSKIFVIVSDGEARVQLDTVPENMIVEIIDLDTIRHGESFPSPEAFNYCRDNNIFIERRKRGNIKPDGRRDEDVAAIV